MIVEISSSARADRQLNSGGGAVARRKSRRPRNGMFLSATEALAAGSATSPGQVQAPDLSGTLNGLALREERAGVEQVWLWLGGDRKLVPSAEVIVAQADLVGAKELFERWRDFAGATKPWHWVLAEKSQSFLLGAAAGKRLQNTILLERRAESFIETARSIPGKFALRLTANARARAGSFPVALQATLPVRVLTLTPKPELASIMDLATEVWPQLHQRPAMDKEKAALEAIGEATVVFGDGGARGVIFRARDAMTGRPALCARLAKGESGLVLPWLRTLERLRKR